MSNGLVRFCISKCSTARHINLEYWNNAVAVPNSMDRCILRSHSIFKLNKTIEFNKYRFGDELNKLLSIHYTWSPPFFSISPSLSLSLSLPFPVLFEKKAGESKQIAKIVAPLMWFGNELLLCYRRHGKCQVNNTDLLSNRTENALQFMKTVACAFMRYRTSVL